MFYLDVRAKEKLYWLAVIQKSEKGNLSKSERNELATLVKKLREETYEPVQKNQIKPRRGN